MFIYLESIVITGNFKLYDTTLYNSYYLKEFISKGNQIQIIAKNNQKMGAFTNVKVQDRYGFIKDLYLKIEGKKRYYDFYYNTSEKGGWMLLAKDIDTVILNINKVRGFVGTCLAMYASENHFGTVN